MNKTFKEKMVVFLDDNVVKIYLCTFVLIIFYYFANMFNLNIILRLLLGYAFYFGFMYLINRFVKKNKKIEK